ncbi:ORF V: Enzymatic polyprotein [Labeo rohita]|uniref:ribonuclease H n=1 Tax=Labeo rohita TaxID=84645 RepID=A0ABQ8N140_LABRO|nr:ORF V: Enzymatic polyprotein [Labeo rohita]
MSVLRSILMHYAVLQVSISLNKVELSVGESKFFTCTAGRKRTSSREFGRASEREASRRSSVDIQRENQQEEIDQRRHGRLTHTTFAFGASSSELFKTEKKEKEFLSSHSLCWRAAELLKELHLKERSAAASLILRAAVFTASTPPALQRAPRLSARLCRGFSLGGPGFQKSEFLAAVEDIFPVCLSGRALPGAVVSSPLWTDVIAVSRAWAESTLRQRSRMSRRSFMSRHPLLSSRGKSLSRQGFSAATARHLGDIQVTMQNVPSPPKAPRTSASPRSPVELLKQYTSPYSGLGISFCAPQEIEMSAAASEGESDDEADDSAGRYPSAVAAPSETDAELSAMLLRAAKEIGLDVPKTAPADPSRLDDWFLGRAPAAPPRSPPVPFFPEVHEELVRTWRAPHSSRPRPSSSPLASLDGGRARCRGASMPARRCHLAGSAPSPPGACEFSSALAGRTYHAAGQAATALHAMATLQVYQAKVLKHLHERGSDQGAMEELALRATKVTARSLGQVMSTIVVQERHLWLTLAQMADVDKSRFLNAPISQGGLFGDTVEDFAQQFSAGPNLRLLVAEGAPPRLPNNQLRPLLRYMTPDWQPDIELAVGERRRPRLRDPSPAKDLRSVPDAGNPEVERIALWGMTTSTSPLPVEGRELSQEESILSPPGFRPRVPSLSSAPEVSPRIRTRSLMSPAREPGKKSPSPSPPGCPTAVTSVNVPLIPLATRLGAWLQLPSPSRWLIRTVRLGYAIQFARRPPRYRGVLSTSVHSDTHAAVLRAEVAVLLAKDAIEPVPPAEMKSGFYSPYFIVPKKSGGLRPILDLRALNRSLLRLPFKMLTTKRMLTCIRPQDWLAAIDLKDAYFHVSILPRHRPFLRFAFEGRAYQYKVLPFSLSLSPRVFTKVAEAALSPLWQTGIRILNYLDDWLLIAHSRDLLCEQRDLVLRHLSHLGLQVNREKSKLSPVQRISFLGVELDSVSMTARLINERAQSVLKCLESFRHKTAVPLKTFQRLLGHMAAAAAVTPLGLLHMRPLQRWLHDRVPRWAWHRGTLRIGVSPQCRRLFSPWSDPAFLQAGVPLGQVSRHLVVYTDASSTGWGAVCNGQAASGSWTGPRLQWHINCLELLAVLLALRRFRPTLRHKHVLVRTDSTATVAYINRQGGLRSRRMSQLARHLLLWSQTWLKSLRAVHIPGELNRAADQLSRQSTHPGEWRLHPETVQLIWSHFGEAQIDLFASPESSHCQRFYSLNEAPNSLGRDALAHSWPPGPKYAFPQTHFPRGSPSLENPLEERPSFSGDGHNLAPAPDLWNLHVWFLDGTRQTSPAFHRAVIETITQSRAPSTRQTYALRWGLFVDWCSSRGEDPQRCTIAVVLSFLQEKLERRLSPSTLKVYVAAIAAYHDAVDGTSLGKHQLIVRFLRGARRVNPPRPHPIPSWDLSVALQGLREAPFEPLASVELKYLSLKTALLTALASIKRVGDLQAFSVDEACLEFGPGDSHVILRPRPGYVPKVPTTPFRDQVVNLQALPLEEADPASALLCPVRALRIYVDHTRHFRRTEQLFVCFGGQQKGNAVSKQRLAHWVVDAISLSYQNQGEPCPLGVRAHSTRSVASSYALAHGASLADICRAAGWATPNTFARFYNLRVEAVSSRVLK